jgi:hypothetical protein
MIDNGHDAPERVCACGCKRSLEAMRKDARWYSEACMKAWMRKHPGRRLSEAHSTDKALTRQRSGLQVTYAKATTAACRAAGEARLAQGVPVQVLVERQMKRALSDRQRARLEQRQEAV